MLSSVPTCCAAYRDQRANPANFGRRDSGRNDTFPHVQRPGAPAYRDPGESITLSSTRPMGGVARAD